MAFEHVPVLPEEVLQRLQPRSGGIYVDGTLGGGGHAELVLQASSPSGIVIGFDRDPAALQAASLRLARFGERFRAVRANFSSMSEELRRLGIAAIDGFLLDLGVSSHQLDTEERGFSFSREAPLDMRMDPANPVSARDLVNELPAAELAEIIRDFGEERYARRVASRIVEARQSGRIETTAQLAEIVRRALPRPRREEKIDPATRTFQAIRIAVNEELTSLEKGLEAALGLLRTGGRGVVISFHSLEDRIVKEAFRERARGCICPKSVPLCTCGHAPEVKVLTSKPQTAAAAEVAANPRARSAKLRAVEKIV